MSKQFLSQVIQNSTELSAVAAGRLAGDLIAAVTAELVSTGGYTLPSFGTFTVRETAKRKGLNPRTGEPVNVKAGATVRFKASPLLKEAALIELKKSKRKAGKASK